MLLPQNSSLSFLEHQLTNQQQNSCSYMYGSFCCLINTIHPPPSGLSRSAEAIAMRVLKKHCFIPTGAFNQPPKGARLSISVNCFIDAHLS